MDTSAFTELRFGHYRIDANNGWLLAGNESVELRPKAFQVLHYLASNAGRLVTKDELFDAVWPKTIVTDDSLVQCVTEIRRVLGDNRQEIIRTVPRRGYVFTPAVAETRRGPLPKLHTDATAMPVDAGMAVAPKPKAWWGWGLTTLLVVVAAVVASALSATSPPAAPSIVVLPLASRNGNSEQDYFAEAVTAELTTDLSRLPGATVIAHNSALSYRGKHIDVRQIGNELSVDYVLEGSLQRNINDVQLHIHLVDASSGRQLWSERFQSNQRDLANLQRQITGTVARSLDLQLIEAEAARVRSSAAFNPEAQDLTWQAWSLYERRTADSVADARGLLERALRRNSESALAWALLSSTYTADLLNRWMHMRQASRDDWIERADQAAQKANALDPNNLIAIGAWATVLQLQGRPVQARVLFEKQLNLNRNYAPAWHRLSYAQVTLGEAEAALISGREAIRLSPRDGSLYSFYVVMAAACLHVGRDAEALDWAQKAVAHRPNFGIAHAWVAAAAANLEKMDEARAAIAEFRRLQPDYTIASFRAEKLSENPVFLEQRQRYYQGLRRAGLPE